MTSWWSAVRVRPGSAKVIVMKLLDLRLPRITPKDVLAAEPCEDWTSERVHAFFRKSGKRELTIKDAFRYWRAKVLDSDELYWLIRNFSPEIFDEMVVAAVRNRSHHRKLWDAFDYELFVEFAERMTDEEVLDEFTSCNQTLYIDMIRGYLKEEKWY